MELGSALIVYLVITIALVILLIRLRIRTYSAIAIGLLVGQVLLNFLAPPTTVSPFSESDSVTALYFLVQIATPVFLIVYILIMGINDKRYSYTTSPNSLLNISS